MAIITDGVRTKFTDDTGLPLIGGQVFSYVEGTSTPKDTYQDRAFTIPNTNPIILDDVGSCEMYLNGGYRLRVLTADGVLVEEKDNAFQSDGQVLDVVANTTAIAALQTNVDVLNTRGGLKTDENNHIIGQGKAESATVYDLSLRSDKIRVSAPTDVEFGDLVFKTYDAPTVANGVTIPKGTWLNPALVTPLLGTAATKNAGYAVGDVALIDSSGVAGAGIGTFSSPVATQLPRLLKSGSYTYSENSDLRPPNLNRYDTQCLVLSKHAQGYGTAIWFPYGVASANNIVLEAFTLAARVFHTIYTDKNTNKGTNGALSAKSPVTHLYHDRVEHTGNDLELQPIEFIKNSVGNYTLKNTTGFAQEGWYIIIPQDANGNQLVAVEYEDNNGDINVRTYKRKFDFEQAKIVADHDNPLDIPETRWIDLRFNDDPSLYGEVTDEPIE